MIRRWTSIISALLIAVMCLGAFDIPALAMDAPISETTALTLSDARITLNDGEQFSLSVTATPSGVKKSSLLWKSSDKKVATVSKNGTVKAVSPGKARITAGTSNGKIRASCTVTVKAVLPQSLELNHLNATVKVGKTLALKASVAPTNATTKAVTWQSSNPKVASVNSKGIIQGKKAGTVKITATTKQGKIKASCTVKVEKVIKPKSLTLDQLKTTVVIGDKITLVGTVMPANADDKALEWKSGDKRIATVNSKGLVTAKRVGKVKIMARTKTGKKMATCVLTVRKEVLPKSVKLNQASAALNPGETLELKATVSPTNADDQRVKWSSNNTKVAEVSSTGVVTALAPGTAKITAATAKGKKQASATVVVNDLSSIGEYRALLIGQEQYRMSGTLNGPRADVDAMKGMLSNAQYTSVTARYNLTAKQITAAIKGLQSMGIKENDVTLVFYSGHGMESSDIKYRGALLGIDEAPITVEALKKLLDPIPGTVILMLDSCLSGQYITSKSSKSSQAQLEEHNKAVVSAFQGTLSAKSLTNCATSGKYKIITAASSLGYSYTTPELGSHMIGAFTYYLTRGGGWDAFTGRAGLLADKDKNRTVTVDELYQYTKKNVNAYFSQMIHEQKTQVWPSGDAFPVIVRDSE